MKNIIKKWLGIDKLDQFKECEKCGYLCHIAKMKKVEARGTFVKFENYYCLEHTPDYDERVFCPFGVKYYKNNVEVNEKGKPICTNK